MRTPTIALLLFLPLATAAAPAQNLERIASQPQQERRGWLGIVLEGDEGKAPTVAEVTPGSPADKGGLKIGDVVLQLNGAAVADMDAFIARVQGMKAGDKVTMRVRRGEAEETVSCELGTRPGERAARPQPAQPTQPRRESPQEPAKPAAKRGYLGVYLDSNDDGVGIREVIKGSAAEKAGLKEGDRLLRVNGQAARDLAAVTERIGSTGAGNVLKLTIQRGDDEIEFAVKLAGELPAEVEKAAPAPPGAAQKQPADAKAAPAKQPPKPETAEPAPRAQPRRPSPRPDATVQVRWLENLERARVAAAERQVPILIDFGAEWCRPCKMLDESFQDAKVAALLGRFVPVRVDVDKQSRLADEFEVGSIPHVVVLASDGKKKLGSFIGYLPAADLAERLKGWIEASGGGRDQAAAEARGEMGAEERAQAERRRAEARRAAAERQANEARRAERAAAEASKSADAELQQALKDLLRTQSELSKRLEDLMRRLEKLEGKGTGR